MCELVKEACGHRIAKYLRFLTDGGPLTVPRGTYGCSVPPDFPPVPTKVIDCIKSSEQSRIAPNLTAGKVRDWSPAPESHEGYLGTLLQEPM